MGKKVLIMTHSKDVTGMIPELTRKLEEHGCEVMRFNNDEFPSDAQLSLSYEGNAQRLRFRYKGQEMELGPDDAVWYRRARIAEKLPPMDPQLRQGAVLESKALFVGALAAAPCFLLDSPLIVRTSDHKPRQLQIAREIGFDVPRSLMTNDPADARAFIESCPGGVIAKMLASFPVYDDQGEEQVVITTKLTTDHLDKLEGLRYSPMVFQEQIRKAVELRITVIGNRIFSACVDSESTQGAEIDWRARGVTLLKSWKEYPLGAEIEAKIARYMERVKMQYSAIDIIVEPSGRLVFLEANPAGECFWLQYNSPNFPLSDALADVLLDKPGARRDFST